MNKTLILAFAIAVASFGCADEEVASVTTTDGTVAPAESAENIAAEPAQVTALTVEDTMDATDEVVDSVASIDVNDVVETTDDAITAQVDQTTDAVNDTVSSIDNEISDNVNNITFENIDTDLDGVITEAEAESNETLENVFTKLDLDQNGDLSEAEFKQFAMLVK
jgi:hypothetical protein